MRSWRCCGNAALILIGLLKERSRQDFPSGVSGKYSISSPAPAAGVSAVWVPAAVLYGKGPTTRLTAPAYWKFESISLQRRVRQNFGSSRVAAMLIPRIMISMDAERLGMARLPDTMTKERCQFLPPE